jgi:hypothetical protein
MKIFKVICILLFGPVLGMGIAFLAAHGGNFLAEGGVCHIELCALLLLDSRYCVRCAG